MQKISLAGLLGLLLLLVACSSEPTSISRLKGNSPAGWVAAQVPWANGPVSEVEVDGEGVAQ